MFETPFEDNTRRRVRHLLAALLLTGLAACGGNDDSSAAADSEDTEPAAQAGDPQGAARAPAPAAIINAVPPGYVRCAGQFRNTTCQFTGRVTMVYGARNSFATGEVDGPFNCNTGNAVFGNPLPGVVKSCYIPGDNPPPPPPPPGTAAASIVNIELAQSLVFPSGDSALVLAANRAVLVKVNATTSRPGDPKPAGTLRVETATGELVRSLPLTPPSGALPSSPPLVPSFADAYSAVVPAELVKSGLRLSASLANGQPATVVNPRVGGGVALTFVAVPMQIGSTVGQVVADPDRYLAARLPAASVSLQVRAPYVSRRVTTLPTSESAWSSAFSALLRELDDLHTLEQASNRTLYYGFVPKRTFGLAGLGFVPGTAAIGFDIPNRPTSVLEVMAHEVGHNLSLPHAPCGGPARADPNYPYPNAQLGAPGRYIWGYNAITNTFVDPRPTNRHDIMSYCDGDTFSDYNYRRMQTYLTPGDASLAFAQASAAATPQELMLISGDIESGGVAALSPLKSLFGRARLPQDGPYTLRLVTAGGVVEYRFGVKEIDHDPTRQRFSFTIPHPGIIESASIVRDGVVMMQSEGKAANRAQALRAGSDRPQVQVSEQGRVLRLSWDAARYPYLTVTHVGSERAALALDLEGGTASLPIEKLPAGGSFEFSLSDGLNTVRLQQAR